MKNAIYLIAAVLALFLLLKVASDNFDNVRGNFVAETTKENIEAETESKSQNSAIAEMNYDFTVIDENGNDVKHSELTDKPMIVIFWASWNATSRLELATIWEVYDIYCDSVEFMLVCITDGEHESVESAKAYMAETNYDFPVYFDVYAEAFHNYQLYETPEKWVRTHFFYDIDENGNRKHGNIKEGVVLRTDLIEQIVNIVTQ